MKEVSVSFLSADDPAEAIKKLNNSTCDYIHFDVMDGKFVKNKNLSKSELKYLLPLVDKKIDVHLMVKNPNNYIKLLVKYDISYITIHYEIKDYLKYINMIKSNNIKVGICIKP